MNKNNIFNFVKYTIFAGILYFVIKKIPSINIKEFEILLLITIIGAGVYSYECLIDGFFTKKEEDTFEDLEKFSNDDIDDSLELDVDIDDKYSHLNKNYDIINPNGSKTSTSKSRSKISVRNKELPNFKVDSKNKKTIIPRPVEPESDTETSVEETPIGDLEKKISNTKRAVDTISKTMKDRNAKDFKVSKKSKSRAIEEPVGDSESQYSEVSDSDEIVETREQKLRKIKSKMRADVDYKIDDENTDNRQVRKPVAAEQSGNQTYSKMKSKTNSRTKASINQAKKNKQTVNRMMSKDSNVGLYKEKIQKEETRKLYDELIKPNEMNPEDLQAYGINKFDLQDEELKNASVKDYDSVMQESLYQSFNEDLENKGLLRKKYVDKGPKVLKVANAFIKGTSEYEKVLVDPDTGKEVVLNDAYSDYVYTDKKTGKKYVYVVDDEILDSDQLSNSQNKVVKKVFIDDEGINSSIRKNKEEVLDDESVDDERPIRKKSLREKVRDEVEDELDFEDDDEEDSVDDLTPISGQETVPVENILDGASVESELAKARKEAKVRTIIPDIPKLAKQPKKPNLDELEKEAGIKKLDPDEIGVALPGGMKLRSKNEIRSVQKKIKQMAEEKALKKISGEIPMEEKRRTIIKEIVRERPQVVKEVSHAHEHRSKRHHHEHSHEHKHKGKTHGHKHRHEHEHEYESNDYHDEHLDCKSEVMRMKKHLQDEIDLLREQLGKRGGDTLPFIQKRNIKVLLKELVKNNILDQQDMKEILSYIDSENVSLDRVIKALERLRTSTAYIDNKKDNRYGDMKYDEIPAGKSKAIGDQVPNDWENEYTLLNTDKWTVPMHKPELCIKNSNVNPLPSNEPGYPMALKEWDSSRSFTNQYINKKWAMDQVDSS